MDSEGEFLFWLLSVIFGKKNQGCATAIIFCILVAAMLVIAGSDNPTFGYLGLGFLTLWGLGALIRRAIEAKSAGDPPMDDGSMTSTGDAQVQVTPQPLTDDAAGTADADAWAEYRKKQQALDLEPGEAAPVLLEAAPEPEIVASNKSPILAAMLSFVLFGGGGQFYLGQWKKGLLLIVAGLFLNFLLVLGIFVAIIGVADAYGTAKKMSEGIAVGEWEFNFNWVAGGLALLIYVMAAFGIIALLCTQGC